MDSSSSKDFRVLSIDGGGIRGFATLVILKQMMKAVSPEGTQELKPCEYFHFIGGAGFGGVLAILLGRLGLSVSDCMMEYWRLSSTILRKETLGAKPPLYDATKLRIVMDDIVARYTSENPTGEKPEEQPKAHLLADPGQDEGNPKACIFAVRVADGKRIPHCFRTYKKPDRTRDDEPELSPTLSITDAVVAATAAEGLFEEAFLSNGEQQVKFMDILYPLGLIDPTNLIFQELKSLPHPDPISQLISVGSGNVAYDDIGHLLQLGVPKSPLNSTITALNRFLQATRSALWAYERSGAVHIETMCDNPVYAHPQTVAAHLSDQYRETIRELPLEVYRRFDIKPVPDVGPNDFLSLKELGEAAHEYLNLIQLQSSKSYLRRGNLEALCWAVRTHNDVVVSELIQRFQKLGRYYASDLLAAVKNKHQRAAMVLELMNSGKDLQDFFFHLREEDWEQQLKIDSNLASTTDIGCEVGGERKTLLEVAARKGYAKLMQLLLDRLMCDHRMDDDVTNVGRYTLLEQ